MNSGRQAENVGHRSGVGFNIVASVPQPDKHGWHPATAAATAAAAAASPAAWGPSAKTLHVSPKCEGGAPRHARGLRDRAADRHWSEHLDSGQRVAQLLEELAAELAESPATQPLLARLAALEQAIAAADQAAFRAIKSLDKAA